MFFWNMISCACGTAIGMLLANIIIEHEQKKSNPSIVKLIENVKKDMNNPNYFAETFGDDYNGWDKLWKRSCDISDRLNAREKTRFTNEVIVAESLEDKNKVCEKYERELEKINNKEK